MKKLFLLFVKFMPAIQMAGMLVNNTLCYFNVNPIINYIFDFSIGNSILTTIFMFICSYMFGFCAYYRLILSANLINLIIAMIDSMHRLPIDDIHLLAIYYVICSIFIIIITINHIKSNHERLKVKNSKKSS